MSTDVDVPRALFIVPSYPCTGLQYSLLDAAKAWWHDTFGEAFDAANCLWLSRPDNPLEKMNGCVADTPLHIVHTVHMELATALSVPHLVVIGWGLDHDTAEPVDDDDIVDVMRHEGCVTTVTQAIQYLRRYTAMQVHILQVEEPELCPPDESVLWIASWRDVSLLVQQAGIMALDGVEFLTTATPVTTLGKQSSSFLTAVSEAVADRNVTSVVLYVDSGQYPEDVAGAVAMLEDELRNGDAALCDAFLGDLDLEEGLNFDSDELYEEGDLPFEALLAELEITVVPVSVAVLGLPA